jgi:hypothetical protein
MTEQEIRMTIEEIVEYNKPYCLLQDIPTNVIDSIIEDLTPIHAIYGEGKQQVWRTYIKPICFNEQGSERLI